MTLNMTFLNPDAPSWSTDIDQIYVQMDAPRNPQLMPPYFMKSTFARIGGQIFLIEKEGKSIAAGFLFPQALVDSRPSYIMRIHYIGMKRFVDIQDWSDELGRIGIISLYSPDDEREYHDTHRQIEEFDIGSPSLEEAHMIRRLQQEIWGSSEGDLYPIDIHSADFQATTSFVARHNGAIAGFLFSFLRFGSPGANNRWADPNQHKLCIESQLLGVVPKFRGRGLGRILKIEQRRIALQNHISVIHWTVDPLQFGNAILNFEKLGAVSFEFYPDYYAFTNKLNRVSASRLGITWLLDSNRVLERLNRDRRIKQDISIEGMRVIGLSEYGDLAKDQYFDDLLAIEVPSDWTLLQQKETEYAILVRERTDQVFLSYLRAHSYVITDVGRMNGRCFLIVRRLHCSPFLI